MFRVVIDKEGRYIELLGSGNLGTLKRVQGDGFCIKFSKINAQISCITEKYVIYLHQQLSSNYILALCNTG